jgi:hypothetical protein
MTIIRDGNGERGSRESSAETKGWWRGTDGRPLSWQEAAAMMLLSYICFAELSLLGRRSSARCPFMVGVGVLFLRSKGKPNGERSRIMSVLCEDWDDYRRLDTALAMARSIGWWGMDCKGESWSQERNARIYLTLRLWFLFAEEKW